MKKIINLSVLVITCLFLITILSCGSDTEDNSVPEYKEIVEPDPVVPPVQFKAAIPGTGSTLRPDQSIAIFFTAFPENLTVVPGTIGDSESEIIISGPFPLGDISIELTWAGGNHTLEYTVVPENMVMIRSGEFQMGSDSEIAAEDERPVHTVFVDSFFIDIHEVTVAQYKQFVQETGYNEPEWRKVVPYAPTDRHPMVFVSWHDAMTYAKWAGKRLPTEAEWEKAARGGHIQQKYPWGNLAPTGKQCNFADKNLAQHWWADEKADDGYTFTAPVGRYPGNDYGLYDMGGNVLEWCLDEYDESFYTVSQPENPISGTDTIAEILQNFKTVRSNRVLRGGSWLVNSHAVRNAVRFRLPPSSLNNSVGFRCAKDVLF